MLNTENRERVKKRKKGGVSGKRTCQAPWDHKHNKQGEKLIYHPFSNLQSSISLFFPSIASRLPSIFYTHCSFFIIHIQTQSTHMLKNEKRSKSQKTIKNSIRKQKDHETYCAKSLKQVMKTNIWASRSIGSWSIWASPSSIVMLEREKSPNSREREKEEGFNRRFKRFSWGGVEESNGGGMLSSFRHQILSSTRVTFLNIQHGTHLMLILIVPSAS